MLLEERLELDVLFGVDITQHSVYEGLMINEDDL